MDSQFPFATREDLWRLQNDMKSVYSIQAEHSDRILRLEKRQDEDNRIKSVWGGPAFANTISGATQQDSAYNPAAEAFKTFDQDQSSTLLGSLHLEPEEEPRRGASRANSVRFDESALHGHLTSTSRSSSEIFPVRTGSAFGSLPMTERSSSHKSEGRPSSTGPSTHSTRLNSFVYDSRPLGLAAQGPNDPAPGLSLLGPLPSIIRCWLDTRFSNDSLLYAAVCTGSFKSSISLRLVNELSLSDQICSMEHEDQIKLAVYFPEATIQQSSLRSASPAPQLPVLTVTFEVIRVEEGSETIEIIFGSDILRSKNADILFSQSRMTIYDDDHNKLSIPLVRPEKASLFQRLATVSGMPKSGRKIYNDRTILPEIPSTAPNLKNSTYIKPATQHENEHNGGDSQASTNDKRVRGVSKQEQEGQRQLDDSEQSQETSAAPGKAAASTNLHSPATSDHNGVWRTWRRETEPNQQSEATFSSVASKRGSSGTSRGKGMKVLKPARLSTSATMSASRPSITPSKKAFSGVEDRKSRKSSEMQDVSDASQPDANKRPLPSESTAIPLSASGPAARSPNPIGVASAFGWLNSGQQKNPPAST